ncbi:hypothetical protein SCANM63S_07603 [Streptomyces canarius]
MAALTVASAASLVEKWRARLSPAEGDTTRESVLSTGELNKHADDIAQAALSQLAARSSQARDQVADLTTRFSLSPDMAADLTLCVVLLRDLKRKLYTSVPLTASGRTSGPGVRSADDSQLGIGGARSLLAPAAAWTPVTDPDAIADVLAPGETALILWDRRLGPGHAIAAYYTTEGIRWVDPQAPAGRRVSTAPPSPWDAVDAHAVVLGRDGQPRPGALEQRSMGATTVRALTDPLSDSRYGTNLKSIFGMGKRRQ